MKHSAPTKQQLHDSMVLLMKDALRYRSAEPLVRAYQLSVIRLDIELGSTRRITRQ